MNKEVPGEKDTKAKGAVDIAARKKQLEASQSALSKHLQRRLEEKKSSRSN